MMERHETIGQWQGEEGSLGCPIPWPIFKSVSSPLSANTWGHGKEMSPEEAAALLGQQSICN